MTNELNYDVLADGCPSRAIMQSLGDKWTALVLLILADGPVRFSVLRQRIGTVTPKVLTQTLRSLERDGLVDREQVSQGPPRVDYALTELGVSLLEPIRALRQWSQSNAGKILQARQSAGGTGILDTQG